MKQTDNLQASERITQDYKRDAARIEEEVRQNQQALHLSQEAKEDLLHLQFHMGGDTATDGFDSRRILAISDDNTNCLKRALSAIDDCLDDLHAQRCSLTHQAQDVERHYHESLRAFESRLGARGQSGLSAHQERR